MKNIIFSRAIKPMAFVLGILLVICSENMSIAESLYVFYPTTSRPNIIQKKIEAACPDIEITVFGKYRDFSTRIKQAPPDAVISKLPVIKSLPSYSIKLQGARDGITTEKYVLLSVDRKPDLQNLSNIDIGVIDILGKAGMQEWVATFFPSSLNLKRVTKVEDLLPLLTFDMAKALFITQHHADYFKQISKLNFVITPLPNPEQGIIALAVKNGSRADNTIKSVKSMNEQSNALLEVSNWK